MDNNFKYYDPDINNIKKDKKLISQLSDIYDNRKGMVCGAVRMFKNGELVQDTIPNLVVGLGRQYVAQRLFNTTQASEIHTGLDGYDPIYKWKISHFAVGNGGAATVGDYTNIIGPDVCDGDIYSAISMSNTDFRYLTTPGDPLRGIPPVEKAEMPISNNNGNITTSGSVDIAQTETITCSNNIIFSTVRLTCVIPPGMPDYLLDGDDYININEAALYYVSDIADINNKPVLSRIFAHICFPGKYIEKSSEFVIEWYILC